MNFHTKPRSDNQLLTGCSFVLSCLRVNQTKPKEKPSNRKNPMNIKPNQTKLKQLLLGVLCVSALNLPLLAKDTYWIYGGGPTGEWNTPAYWSNGVPTEYDDAYVDTDAGSSLVINNGLAQANSLFIGEMYGPGIPVTVGVSGTLTLQDSLFIGTNSSTYSQLDVAGVLNYGDAFIGYDGYGELNITSTGTVFGSNYSYNGYSVIGDQAGSKGVVKVTGNGAAYFGDQFFIGGDGAGELYLNGGEVHANTVYLADVAGSTGLLVIGGDGSGKILKDFEATSDPAPIVATPNAGGEGIVRFNHTGDIAFANDINGSNISIEHQSGTTSLTGYISVHDVDVSGGTMEVGNALDASGDILVRDGARLSGYGVYAAAANEINIVNGAAVTSSLELNGYFIYFEDAVLEYVDGYALNVFGNELSIAGLTVDFSAITMGDGDAFIVLDWSGTNDDNVQFAEFTATGLSDDIGGSFSIQGTQLTFTASAVPEPSTWFLLGAGLGALLLTAHYRRRKAQS
jgi:T5SS/PEP-CTERM-associated repeat protein